MANEKISELPSGAPAQGGDAIPIARGGTNYSLAASQIAGLAPPNIAFQLSGNTSGATASLSSGTVILAGGNNITLSQNGQSVTISGASTVPTFSAGVSTIGNTSGNTGITGTNLVLAGGQNITLSQITGAAGATVTISAFSQTVQTQNLVDISLGGNTSGTLALISSGTMILAGGNNITLSQVGNAVTISANTVAPATLSVSAGTVTGAFGGLTFSNSNNVSFGLTNGTITATAISQTVQTQNLVDVTIGGNSTSAGAGYALISSGTMFLAGGPNVTLSQNGQSVSISANTVAAASLSVSAGTTSGGFGGLTFANSNNVSWTLNNGTLNASASQSAQTQNLHDVRITGNTAGTTALISSGTMFLAGGNNITLSQNGQSITISAPPQGGFIAGISNIGNTIGTSGLTGTQLVLAGGNNITVSQATGANGATVTISGGTQTNQSLGIYASSQTVGGASSSTVDARSFTHVGQGIVSVGLSAGSLLFSATQSVQTMGLYGSSQTTGQASSTTIDARSLSVVGAGIISVGMSQGSLLISSPASTGISQSIYATGNTTQSSSGTASIGSLLIQGAGNVSIGVTNGSLVISGGTAGVVPINFSAGTTSSNLASVVFSNSNGISFGLNGATITASGGSGGGGGVGVGVSTFGNTAGSTGVVTTGNAVFVGSGVISLSQSTGAAGSAATISILAPATSLISATGLVSISTNVSTISIGMAIPQLSFFQPLGPIQSTLATQMGNGTVQVYPAIAAFPFSASRVDMMASVSCSNLAVSTEAQTLSMFVGLYSLNGSTLSLASSGSQTYEWTNSSNGSSSVLSGLRRFSAPINVNYTGGFDIFVGIMSNTTYVNTNGISLSNVVIPVAPAAVLNGLLGETTNSTKQFVPGQGYFSATSAGMPASMAISQIYGIGSGSNTAYAVPVQFVNLTA